ncbi:hypothetical protein [Nannocystis pusilla]|uniref:Uncharacterized protein n=1 Tax=Nannocystis pusilla TaxID=889268 RepID=A0ABS7U5D8_9BACT|nr:hypothetical protein [Nannocystis pusilla]MBZ5715700.1 hypothetical protein [Nannocystis pusilla]
MLAVRELAEPSSGSPRGECCAGPIGVAAVFYAGLARQRTDMAEIWSMTSLLVFTSVVMHA